MTRRSSTPTPRIDPATRRRAAVAALLACATLAAGGCAQVRKYAIYTTPADARVRVNGRELPRAQQGRVQLAFSSPDQTYSVVASRPGFEDESVPVTLDTPPGALAIVLRPKVKPITIRVEPAAAFVTVDGRPVAPGPVASATFDLTYALDARDDVSRALGVDLRPRGHTIRAERPGFAAAEQLIAFEDAAAQYTLRLGPLVKDLTIDTQPGGAALTLDGVSIGVAPVSLREQPFAYDAAREQFVPRTLVATRTGYPPTTAKLAWDEGKREYAIALEPFRKQARIVTEPPDAKVKLDGKDVPRGSDGARLVPLDFPPVDEAGTLQSYALDASVERPGEIWKPLRATIGFDEGRAAYTYKLEEILVRSVPARSVEFQSKDGRWSPTIVEAQTTAFKDVADGPLGKPARVTDLPAGSQIDSFAISPDGESIAYALLDADKKRARSRLFVQRIGGNAVALTDGKQLDVTPAFTPDGDAVVFSSDRGGASMQVWSIPLDGASGTTRLTSGNADHLWPGLDTSPKPRVFYEALVPGQDVPRLYSAQAGTTFETDLVTAGGYQPRLSPPGDALAFVRADEATRRTDLFRAGDRGGAVRNLTNTPEANERDPAWSPDGARLAMTTDFPGTETGRAAQSEIAIVDAEGAGKPTRVTQNDAIDDLPAWAPTGDAIYFRSNRGGKWDVWRIDVK